jgi:hypothetical protein
MRTINRRRASVQTRLRMLTRTDIGCDAVIDPSQYAIVYHPSRTHTCTRVSPPVANSVQGSARTQPTSTPIIAHGGVSRSTAATRNPHASTPHATALHVYARNNAQNVASRHPRNQRVIVSVTVRADSGCTYSDFSVIIQSASPTQRTKEKRNAHNEQRTQQR